MRFLIRILAWRLKSLSRFVRSRRFSEFTIYPGDMVKQAKSIWSSDLSVKERIRLKSQVLVEDSILEIFSILHNRDNAIPARLDAFKQLARVAEVDQPERGKGDTGSRFTVSINLGDTIKPVVIEGDTNAE